MKPRFRGFIVRALRNRDSMLYALTRAARQPKRHADAMFRRPARQHAQVAPIFKATALWR